MTSSKRPIVCTLTDASAAGQLLEWADLRGDAVCVAAVPGGARMRFPAEMEAQVADLAAREASCCAFLDLRLVVGDGEVVLDVTSSNPDALPVIAGLAGLPVPPATSIG